MTTLDAITQLPERYTAAPMVARSSPAQRAAAARAADFLREVLLPLDGTDDDPLPPALEAELCARAREYGLWAVAVPEEHGGQGLGEMGYVLVREIVAQATVGDIRHERGVGGDPWPALYYANPDQRERYLRPVVAGEQRMFFALTEPGAGSDAAGITTAARKAAGGWVIDGRKKWIGRGGVNDFGVVIAVTDAERGARGGVTAFFVERTNPGFRHVRDIDTMGAARPAELAFDECFVADDAVLGEVGSGFVYAQRTLSVSRVRQASLNLGAAQRAFDLMVRWLPERHTFGKPLAAREALRWKVARAAVDLRAARLLVYSAATQIDAGMDPRWEVPFVKTCAAQMACRVIDLAIQVHGALGISRDLPLERLYRDIRGFRITEGADELQRVLVARELLGRE